MPEPEPFISLGLSAGSRSQPQQVPAAESLQFRRAEHAGAVTPQGPTCLACSRAISESYFHVHGKTVCTDCAQAIEARRAAPPVHSLVKAFFYGLGAAIAGSALYALVAMVTGIVLSLISIVIGVMVGKAIRHASGGLGGRPQQIMAVLLTYFAISSAYIPIAMHEFGKTHPKASAASTTANTAAEETPAQAPVATGKNSGGMSAAVVIATLFMLAFAAPFLGIASGSGILTLLIILFGLLRAWKMTGRTELAITGPYQVAA